MAEFIGILNLIRLNDLNEKTDLRDRQYNLDRKADRIATKTKESPQEREDFTDKLPTKEPKPFLNRMFESMFAGTLLGGLLTPTGLVLGGLVMGTLVAPAAVIGAIVVGTAIGATLGAIDGLLRTDRPISENEKLNRYENYLATFEREHSHAPQITHSQEEEKSDSKWQERVAAQQQIKQEISANR